MRYTPYLDRIGVKFKDDVPDHAVNIIDTALSIIDAEIKWGEHDGKKRKPCPENPVLLAGQPLGQYHCPHCGMMVMASMPHFEPDQYEAEYGQPWPPGYKEAE